MSMLVQQKEVKAVRTKTTNKKKIPLATVYALYEMKEFYISVYDPVSYVVDLLCLVCDIRGKCAF